MYQIVQPMSEKVIGHYGADNRVNEILRRPLQQHHLQSIHERSKPQLDVLHDHLKAMSSMPNMVEKGAGLLQNMRNSEDAVRIRKMYSKITNEQPIRTAGFHSRESIGGSAGIGGSMHLAGSLPEGDQIKNHQDLYHFTLDLSPRQWEMLREIAVQLLGGKPSPMWGRLVNYGDEPLESKRHNYEHIYMFPTQHAAAKMVEAEYGHGREGGGFGKALKHVARIGSKILKAGHHALGFVNRNKDLLMQVVPDKYKGEAEAFLETANRIDDAVNPIVDATIDAVKHNATQSDKDKLKKIAEEKITKVVEERVPKGKEIVKLAKDIQETMNKPVYSD